MIYKDATDRPALRWMPFVELIERVVVALLALLVVVIILATLVLVGYLVFAGLRSAEIGLISGEELQGATLRAFAGILLVLLGLELLDTVKVYFMDHTIRVEVILMVGLIAMGRHVLELDLHHTDPMTLFGISSLILALSVGYYLMKRTKTGLPELRGSGTDDHG